jgi:hypothetical protein
MPLSRFPGYGVRLAPSSLREVLEVPLPRPFRSESTSHALKLCDLDEQAWRKFSPEACVRLGQLVVETVRRAIPALPMNIKRRLVSPPPQEMALEDLHLEQRTYNCLRRLLLDGQMAKVGDLAQKTIGDLLSIEGFGAKCLVDLLTSLETTQARGTESRPQPKHEDTGPQREEDASLRLILSRIRHLRLPKIPEGVMLVDLSLAARTHNCLEKQGYLERPHDLEELTVEQALEIPGFGMQSLMDYLAAIERQKHGNAPGEDGQSRKDEELPLLAWTLSGEDSFLEDELRALVSQRRTPRFGLRMERNAGIVMEYLGLDGSGGATLKAIGDKYGLTRERVRQICNRTTRGLKPLSSVPPLLQRTLDFVSQRLPAEAGKLETQLQREGLTRGPFRLEGLASAVKLLDSTPPFEIEEIDGRRMVVHPERVRMGRRTIFLARKAVERFGVSTVADVAARVTQAMSAVAPAEFVIGVLEGRQEFEWLDREAGWFWIRSLAKNRVLNRIRKILSVTEVIDVGELRSGIARHHAMDGYAPPRRVLLELCRRLPYCQVEGSFVRARPGLDWQAVLRGTELTMAKILKEHGPIMQRAKFEELCLGAGMKRATFYAYLDYSPIVERYASGVYGLRGASVPPGVAESLIPHNERPPSVRLGHGWTNDRKIWIGYRLSDAMTKNGAFSVPSGLKKFLQGNFTLKAADGNVMGTLSIRENSGWGLGPFYRRRGGEAGDTLLIVFDLNRQEALVGVGDEAILEPFQRTCLDGKARSPEAADDIGHSCDSSTIHNHTRAD